jgi:hypothetical protein
MLDSPRPVRLYLRHARRLALLSCLAAAMVAPPSIAGAQPVFTDVALESGFQDRLGHGRALVAADFNGDGWVDFYLGNPTRPQPPSPIGNDESLILLNNGPVDGQFSWSRGQVLLRGEIAFTASAADYDNDGDPDLFVGIGGKEGAGLDYLFRNDNGNLVDVSQVSGIRSSPGGGPSAPKASISANWADFDRDGHLDLFVASEINDATLEGGSAAYWRDTLFRNNGDGTFSDVTSASGIRGIFSSKFASWGDFDNDGWPDLFVPHDRVVRLPELPSGYQLYRNNQDGTFTDVGLDPVALGVGEAAFWASAAADFDNDGRLDIMVWGRPASSAPDDSHAVLMNLGDWQFSNEAQSSGLVSPDVDVVSVMGCQVGDVTNDGYPDLIMANGAMLAGAVDDLFVNTYTTELGLSFSEESAAIDYPAPPDPTCALEVPCNPPYPYRGHGVVLVDFDLDGDLDVAMSKGGTSARLPFVPSNEPNRLFRNDFANEGRNWLFIELEGAVSNRDGIGARIRVDARQGDEPVRSIYQEVKGGSAFAASGPREVHIGLGTDDTIDSITVSWPSGVETVITGQPINQRIVIDEGVLWHEDFAAGDAVAWRTFDGAWSVREGRYRQSDVTPRPRAALAIADVEREDFTVVGRLTYRAGAKSLGLMGRASPDGERYYAVMLSDTTAQLVKRDSGRITALGSPLPIEPMSPGRSYVVSLELDGSAIRMAVDGRSAEPVVDTGIATGAVGIQARGAEAELDDIIVHTAHRRR